MTKDELNRLHTMREYLEGWDWSLAPWFVLSEKDAKILNRVIEKYENTLEQKREDARRRKRLKKQKLEADYDSLYENNY